MTDGDDLDPATRTPAILIRRERPSDHAAVAAIHREAFRHPDLDHGEPPVEVALVAALRDDVGFVPALSLVAEVDGAVAGHAIGTTGAIDDVPALGLGPIGVDVDRHGLGIGSALMFGVLGAAEALDHAVVCLLGSTAWYPRFGFVPASSVGITSPDPNWGAHFQARVFDTTRPWPQGRFRYATPFDAF